MNDELGEAMKLYKLLRTEDPGGVSGTGTVGLAVEFADGTTVVKFQVDAGDTAGDIASYHSLERAMAVHGHGGSTVFESMQGYFVGGVWIELVGKVL